MKKFFSKSLAVLLTCLMLWAVLPQQAHAAGISFSGSGSLRAGNTVTVTFSVSGSNILAIEATLNYDSSTLELQGTKRLIGGSWDMQQNGSKIILRDTALSSPINSSTGVFSATFRVKSGVSAGTTVSASVSGVYVSDGSSDISLGSASWSAEILPPLSGNANLDDLWCDNAELNFTGGTEYSITVPYSVSSLDLDWERAHSGSSVSVSGNSLSVGSNTVTVTVEAENGTTKRYYIYVTRQQDPNYVPSTDAALSSLSLSAGTLSPAFAPNVTDYVVYLPYEVSTLTVSASANDSKAKGVTQVRKVLLPAQELPTAETTPTDNKNTPAAGETQPTPAPAEPQYELLAQDAPLPEGETLYVVTCTAEDGTTTKDYTIHVIRMPLYAGVLPEIIPPVTEPVVEPEPEPEPEPTTYDISLPLVLTLPYIGEVTLQQAALGALIVLGVLLLLLLLVAWLIGRRGGRKRALRQLAEATARPGAPAEALLDRLAAQEAAAAVVTSALSDTEESAPEVPENSPAGEQPAGDVSAEEESIPAEVVSAAAEESPTEEAAPAAEDLSAEDTPAEPEDIPAETPTVEEEEIPAEEPAEEDAAPAEEIAPEEAAASTEEETPAEESSPAEEETPAEERASEEDAASAEESASGEPQISAEETAEEEVDFSTMSLDDLLEDIRNM